MLIDRNYLIKRLLSESFERIHSSRRSVWMHNILENGFIGFEKMNDKQLLDYYHHFGLSEPMCDPGQIQIANLDSACVRTTCTDFVKY
jgi:hypothetical protein